MKPLLAALATLFMIQPAQAVIREVPSEYTTIQEGIIAASPGDTVRIADDTYSGPGNRDLDFMGKPILVTSASGDPDSCTIDCGGSWLEPHRGFWFHTGEDTFSVLRGIRIVRGYSAGYGGGILCGDEGSSTYASPRIAFCALDSNVSILGAALDIWGIQSKPRLDSLYVRENPGNGIGMYDSATPALFRACNISGNTGYGVYATGGPLFISPFLNQCEIRDNQLSGFVLVSLFARPRLDDCDIVNNGGWGIECSATEDGDCFLNGGTISLNTLGGIKMRGTLTAEYAGVDVHNNEGPGIQTDFWGISYIFDACEIRNNSGDGILIGNPGRPSLSASPMRSRLGITQCNIHDNDGMGINFNADLPFAYTISESIVSRNGQTGIKLATGQAYEGQLDLRNNTVVFNGGDGIRFTTLLSEALPCSITNNLSAFNDGQGMSLSQPDSLILVANDSYGNVLGDWVGVATDYLGQDGNFSGNPLFVDPNLDDFTLADNSPCLPGNHPDGYDTLIGAEELGGDSIDYAPDSVALMPRGWIHVRPGEALDLGVTLFNAVGDTVPDQGIPPSLSLEPGLGVLSAPVLQSPSAWNWRAAYTAGAATGVDLLCADDPECASQTTDSLYVDITETAILTSVSDIPDDQGGQVRIRWERDLHDVLGDPVPITQYVVWRRIDNGVALAGRAVTRSPDLDKIAAALETDAAPPLWTDAKSVLWEPVGPAVPAMLWDLYANVVPTLRDSMETDAALSVFMVSAHTLQPQTFFVSMPDSGYSVDNISPQVPTGLYRAAFGELAWDASTDADFQYFTLYGSESDRLDDGATLIDHVTGTSLEIGPLAHAYLLLTATDTHGNESAAAVLNATTAVESVPDAGLCLFQNQPNPFNPKTTIRYTVPAGGHVSLRIYDVRGALVRELVDTTETGGSHQVSWDGCDDSGRSRASGNYFARLAAGGRAVTMRMVLVR